MGEKGARVGGVGSWGKAARARARSSGRHFSLWSSNSLGTP